MTKAALAGSVQAALEVLPHHVQHHHLSLLKTNSSKFVLCLAGQEEGWRQVVVLVYYTYQWDENSVVEIGDKDDGVVTVHQTHAVVLVDKPALQRTTIYQCREDFFSRQNDS